MYGNIYKMGSFIMGSTHPKTGTQILYQTQTIAQKEFLNEFLKTLYCWFLSNMDICNIQGILLLILMSKGYRTYHMDQRGSWLISEESYCQL